MGGVGRRLLFTLRNTIFTKIESLPVAFFNQNKAGDLVSRINNDTDKLNQFFAQALMQFISNMLLIVGTGILLLVMNPRLGLAALIPALLALITTQLLSGWIKRSNLTSLRALGAMSGEVQESINNFKVIVAFNRLDYFKKKFSEVNEANYKASIASGVASNVLNPIYILAQALAQLFVLAYGIHLLSTGALTVGLLIGFLLYVNSFYMPLRQLASVWSSFQLALAGLDRIGEILSLETNIIIEKESTTYDERPHGILEFENVSFSYPDGGMVLKHVSFTLEPGKTYALVGPTGGGKTTTASLLARLFDPTEGRVLLHGKDIRTISPSERTRAIGFILQEPFLFTGTIQENILYGNTLHTNYGEHELLLVLKKANLTKLLERFQDGLHTKVTSGGDSISLGQKQLIAFMRAVLRSPEILILDEATANIDTVTEQLLQEILDNLPASTTKIIIAHRLNTIENADTIFFVSGGAITHAGNIDQAVEMLLHTKRVS
jgi:ATP-binding cassette subfamily B protein